MERIHVSVRAKPLAQEDAKASPWRIDDNAISTSNHSYEFDRVFGEECTTREVYEARTKELVFSSIAGFNGTVFAYGQTNSGKTHTMRGSKSEPGVIPLAVNDLFHFIQEDVDREFLVRMSYMEIYNEEINDLLAPEHRKLQIHENLERGIFVAGLREEIVNSPEQVLDFMEFGESHRHIGETNMNVYSSRSHTIFRMIIESRNRIEDEDDNRSCDAVRVSVLNLVDLAGSERAAKTGAEGVRLKEGSHINKSLLILGTVIKKLSEGVESQGGHVPYRDSKLTRILQPALGGNANTAIICNITLAQVHADETKSSLQFASRALHVKNYAHINEILTDAALLKRQKKEIEELRAKLLGSKSEHFEDEILNLRNTLLQSELERERIALELQEEKKAKAQRDRRLQEQAKKIANLSSMVLNTKTDENENQLTKNRRRKTWCPTFRSTESTVVVAPSVLHENVGSSEFSRAERDTALVLPFEELVHETESDLGGHLSDFSDNFVYTDSTEVCNIPDVRLMNITNRRKEPRKKKSLMADSIDLSEMQVEYEDLLQKFEIETTMKDIEIECLKKELAKGDGTISISSSIPQDHEHVARGVKSLTFRESEAIFVIKQLEEQIKQLEMEKSALQTNLDSVVELATQQKRLASEKYDEVRHELDSHIEECRILGEKLILSEENTEQEKKCSKAMSAEIDQLRRNLQKYENEGAKSLESEVHSVKSERDLLLAEIEKLNTFIEEEKMLNKSCSEELAKARVDLEEATRKISSIEVKMENLHQELLDTREEARVAHEQLSSFATIGTNEKVEVDPLIKVSKEIQGIELEVQESRDAVNSISSMVDALFENISFMSNMFLELKSSACQNIEQLKFICSNHEKIHSYMREKVAEIVTEKSILQNQSINYLKQIDGLMVDSQKFENAWKVLQQHADTEKEELVSQIQILRKEICSLSSASLAREKEALRKDLEKTKLRLRDADSKLKNSIQDKIKLESEKAYAEREIKLLQGQITLIERDLTKRESHANKSRESLVDRRGEAKEFSKIMVHNNLVEQNLQLKISELEKTNMDLQILSVEYQNLEACANEMMEKNDILEKDLLAANREKEEALVKNENLASECEAMFNELSTTTSELKVLQEEVASRTLKLHESEALCEEMKSSIGSLSREKEEMAMQVTEALLELEEEKAVLSAKEKASLASITEKTNLYEVEIVSLSEGLSKMRHELESRIEECRILEEKLILSEENIEREKKCSMAMSVEIDQLRRNLQKCEIEGAKSLENLKSEVHSVRSERDLLLAEIEKLNTFIEEEKMLNKSCSEELAKARVDLEEATRKISIIEVKMENLHKELLDAHEEAQVAHEQLSSFATIGEYEVPAEINKERAKMRLRLRSTQAKLDAFRGRYGEAVEERKFMDKKFREASAKLKQQLASSGVQILHLKKMLLQKTPEVRF